MHPLTQGAVVLLLGVIVAGGYFALTRGLPERQVESDLSGRIEAVKEQRREIRPGFCAVVRAKVAAGEITVQPGGVSADCL